MGVRVAEGDAVFEGVCVAVPVCEPVLVPVEVGRDDVLEVAVPVTVDVGVMLEVGRGDADRVVVDVGVNEAVPVLLDVVD